MTNHSGAGSWRGCSARFLSLASTKTKAICSPKKSPSAVFNSTTYARNSSLFNNYWFWPIASFKLTTFLTREDMRAQDLDPRAWLRLEQQKHHFGFRVGITRHLCVCSNTASLLSQTGRTAADRPLAGQKTTEQFFGSHFTFSPRLLDARMHTQVSPTPPLIRIVFSLWPFAQLSNASTELNCASSAVVATPCAQAWSVSVHRKRLLRFHWWAKLFSKRRSCHIPIRVSTPLKAALFVLNDVFCDLCERIIDSSAHLRSTCTRSEGILFW